jgi:hypothetical protein
MMYFKLHLFLSAMVVILLLLAWANVISPLGKSSVEQIKDLKSMIQTLDHKVVTMDQKVVTMDQKVVTMIQITKAEFSSLFDLLNRTLPNLSK